MESSVAGAMGRPTERKDERKRKKSERWAGEVKDAQERWRERR